MKNLSKFKTFYREAYLLGHFPSVIKLLFTRKKIFGYYGFLGDQNFGDELVFEAAKNLFAPHLLIPFKKRMPLFHHLFFMFFNSKISGLVIGGGTLIGKKFRFFDEFFKLLASEKPIFFHGTGVRESLVYHKGWGEILKKESYGGIRGPLSREKLKTMGIGARIVGDAAFSLVNSEQISNSQKKSKNVLINFGTHIAFEGETKSRIEIKKFIEYLLKKGYEVQYLPFHKIDLQLGIDLKKSFPQISLLEIPVNYSKALNIFENSRFAVGERLHFNIMASIAGCHFLSVNYGDKHEDFLASLNMPQCGFNPKFLSFEDLVKAFSKKNSSHNSVHLINDFKIIQGKEKERFLENLPISQSPQALLGKYACMFNKTFQINFKPTSEKEN